LITERTRAIVFVDLYGQTIDIDQLKSIAKDIPLIEDAAQASGCRYLEQPVGNLVAATCFSFYPGKNLSAMGDAGAVTGAPDLIARIKMLRDHGRTQKYVHEIVGWNERLDGLQAAVVSSKIAYLDRWNHRRQSNAQVYREQLADCADIVLPAVNPVSNHVYNQFVVRTDRRDNLKQFLLDYNIESGIQFPLAMHQQPVYATADRLPRAELLASTCLSLPVHAQLTRDEVRHVAALVKYFFTLPAHSVEQNTHVAIPN
jgi:dTDP-4-amino-4,6-dideoxygalactose transaminase